MCTSIHFRTEKRRLSRMGELLDLLGPDNVEIDGDWDRAGAMEMRDGCLCPVDIPTTLVECGYRVWKDSEGDSMEYQCEAVADAA